MNLYHINSCHFNFSQTGHAKEALDLAHVQEQTKQLEKQEKIKVNFLLLFLSKVIDSMR